MCASMPSATAASPLLLGATLVFVFQPSKIARTLLLYSLLAVEVRSSLLHQKQSILQFNDHAQGYKWCGSYNYPHVIRAIYLVYALAPIPLHLIFTKHCCITHVFLVPYVRNAKLMLMFESRCFPRFTCQIYSSYSWPVLVIHNTFDSLQSLNLALHLYTGWLPHKLERRNIIHVSTRAGNPQLFNKV